MPSTDTVALTTSLTRDDLTALKIDLRREMKQQVRTEMESLRREQARRRSDLLNWAFMSVMAAVYAAAVVIVVVRVALGG